MARRLLRRRRQRRRAPARPCRRQRDAGHRRASSTACASGSARAFAASTGCSCAAASSRCTCTCSKRCAASATPRPRPTATSRRSPEPEGIRLVWLDLNRVYAGTSLPVVLGRSPQATYSSTTPACRARMRASTGTAAPSSSPTSATTAPTCASTNDPEIISLRRGACTLHGSGVIGLGAPPTDAAQPERALRGPELRRHAAPGARRVRRAAVAPLTADTTR